MIDTPVELDVFDDVLANPIYQMIFSSIPDFKSYVVKSFPIGSRYVCDPPVMDTDKDTLILCDVPSLAIPAQSLLNEGWTPCGEGEYVEGHFLAFRKGEENYVICRD